MLDLFLCFLTSFTLCYLAIPSIIHVARSRQLFDVPDERSSHVEHTPSMGGIAIFASIIFAVIFWTPPNSMGKLQYLLCALIILFLIGTKDDVSPVSPKKKLIGQIMAAAILVLKSDIRLGGLYGILGIHTAFPEVLTFFISILTILVITNAINLIDGINGLAGSVVTLVTATFGAWFFVTGNMTLAIIAFATAGAVLAFLKYNFTPAQIFMGDSGSLILGLITAVLAIAFIDANYHLPVDNIYRIQGGPAVAIGIMIIPLYDTLRVFITRIIRGKSPFQADHRHIHHLIIDSGKTHLEATAMLAGLNMFYIALVFLCHNRLNMDMLIIVELVIISVFTYYHYKKMLKVKHAK
jgi:UDP-N-acetylmuramyl pentapeptide phosphotransferase/UDP-N-acetylglucosamine-1-phosphate transferase